MALLHGFGYLLGYALPRLLNFSERVSRTVSIETGMQSAAMGFALSTHHFKDVLVAVPSAVSDYWAALAVVLPVVGGPWVVCFAPGFAPGRGCNGMPVCWMWTVGGEACYRRISSTVGEFSPWVVCKAYRISIESARLSARH